MRTLRIEEDEVGTNERPARVDGGSEDGRILFPGRRGDGEERISEERWRETSASNEAPPRTIARTRPRCDAIARDQQPSGTKLAHTSVEERRAGVTASRCCCCCCTAKMRNKGASKKRHEAKVSRDGQAKARVWIE